MEPLSKEAVASYLKLQPSLAFDSQFTTVYRSEQLKKLYAGKLIGISQPLKELRAVKSLAELRAMEKSAKLLWKGFEHIRRGLKVGVREKELALSFELFCLKAGAEKLAFDPIIAFGKNSAYPHYRPGSAKLKKGDIVLIDIGVVVDRYHSDMTRTIFFGKPDPRLVVLENVVKKAHAAALSLCKKGAHVGELDKAARRVIEKAGLGKLILHSLGHGIGRTNVRIPADKISGRRPRRHFARRHGHHD